jgi:hypothetical protein
MIDSLNDSLKWKSAFLWALLLLPFLFVIEAFYRGWFYNCNLIWNMIIFLITNVNSLIHEIWHFSMMWLSIFWSLFYSDYTFWKDLTVASWTLFQIWWPIVALIIMLRNKEYLWVAFCLELLAISIYHTAWYMSSARADWVYVSSNFLWKLFDAAWKKWENDWFWLFKRMNLLDYDIVISWYVKGFSFLILIVWLILGFFIIYKTWKVNRY